MVNHSATPSRPEFLLQLRRTFAAPRERVFAAWAEREKLERWMCRDVAAHTVIHRQQDIRTGGSWQMEIRDAAKKEVYWGQGTYLEVTPPEKIVFTWSWSKEIPGAVNQEDMHPESPVTEVTVEFFARGNETDLVLTHRGLGSEKLRKEHEGGWNGCLDELEKTL
jgi:uncharacterized protein YndB with AHSA1/START domain